MIDRYMSDFLDHSYIQINFDFGIEIPILNIPQNLKDSDVLDLLLFLYFNVILLMQHSNNFNLKVQHKIISIIPTSYNSMVLVLHIVHLLI